MSSPDPTLPKDPAEYRPRPLMGLGFWALLAFGVLCVLAGAGVALLAPRLLPARDAPAPAVQEAPAAPEPLIPPPPASATPAPGASAEIQRLNARIAHLESEEARSSEAAAAALAAAAVVEASQGSRPFAGELAALRAARPDLPELAALSQLAAQGAPSRSALAASFPEYAARAASAARTPKAGAGLRERVVYGLSRVVSVRRVSDLSGADADAVLARAERALGEGDVVGALAELEALPPEAGEAIAAWRAGAERRAEIDRHAAALRARALRELEPAGAPA